MSFTHYLISDALWGGIELLLPVHKTNHLLSTHRKRVDNRDVLRVVLEKVLIYKGFYWCLMSIDGCQTKAPLAGKHGRT